jgi:hypothetical protein
MTWLRAEFTPPVVVAQPPPSLQDISSYAARGGWTGEGGFWRRAGIWWMRLVGAPVTTIAYYAAWFAQRPGRAATVAALYAVLAHTTPGRWLPLPWPSWLP